MEVRGEQEWRPGRTGMTCPLMRAPPPVQLFALHHHLPPTTPAARYCASSGELQPSKTWILLALAFNSPSSCLRAGSQMAGAVVARSIHVPCSLRMRTKCGGVHYGTVSLHRYFCFSRIRDSSAGTCFSPSRFRSSGIPQITALAYSMITQCSSLHMFSSGSFSVFPWHWAQQIRWIHHVVRALLARASHPDPDVAHRFVIYRAASTRPLSALIVLGTGTSLQAYSAVRNSE